MDRRVEIYTQTTATDTYGQRVDTDTLSATVWAAVEPIGGDEGVEGNKTTATARVKFTLRYRSGMTEKMKLKHDGTMHHIVLIEEIGRKRFLEITAERQY
jgi:SPP1 family predicted phage head-tail adaptor